MSIFPQILTIDTPKLVSEGEVLGICCDSIIWLTFFYCYRMSHVISWEIRPYYNDTWLYSRMSASSLYVL